MRTPVQPHLPFSSRFLSTCFQIKYPKINEAIIPGNPNPHKNDRIVNPIATANANKITLQINSNRS